MCNYMHALLLHKLINTELPLHDWVGLNFQQTFSPRTRTYNFIKTNHYKVGNNMLCNCFHIINNKLEFDLVDEVFETYKVSCKPILL